MKLSRKFLLLASVALGATLPSVRADVTVKYQPATTPDAVVTGTDIIFTNLSGPAGTVQPTQIQQGGLKSVKSLTVADNTTLTINQLVDATTTNKFLSTSYATQITARNFAALPTIIKTGGATLQYDAFSDIDYHSNNTFKIASGVTPGLPNDLRLQSAYSGMVVVREGTLQVSGFINQWADYGVGNPTYTPRMEGAGAVILQGSSTLSFTGTPLNVVELPPELGSKLGVPSTPLKFRLNYVHNLFSGSQADFLAGNVGTDVHTVLDVGKDNNYIVDLHIDVGVVGSVGRIDGAGRLYKTGLGNFTILNTSRLTGDVFIGGGDLILSDPNGQALRLAASVNLIGANGTQNIAPNKTESLTRTSAATTANVTTWRPGYLPTVAAATLAVTNSQTIRNFQSLWYETATNMWIAGTGGGTIVNVAPGASLTVLQDAGHDGYYTGSINGGDGKFIKDGAGGLALMGQSSTIGEIDINGGRIIANVQSLGYGRVVIGAAGTLNIVQNNAGTLRALINGSAGSVLTVSPKEQISSDVCTNWPNSNIPPDVGNGQLGVIDVYNQQRDFYGSVVVKDGITLAFSYGKDDTFINASQVVLDSGFTSTTPGRETTIRFNDTTQRVNNLTGDANTRIELGRGTITLNHSANTAYAGKITGAGNLIKAGSGSMNLSGLNAYYGATVVRAGTLATTATDAILNSSGLVVGAGATFYAGANATFGALFGQQNSSVVLGNGATLTVGKTDFQLNQLNAALNSFAGQSPDVNPAYFLQTALTPSAVPGMSQANTIGFLRTVLGEPNHFTPIAYSGSKLIVQDAFGVAVGQVVTGTNIPVGTTVAAVTAAPSSRASQLVPSTVIPLASTTNFLVGMPVQGTGIPAGTTVVAVDATGITLSASTSIAATGIITGTSSVTLSAAPTGALDGNPYALSPTTSDDDVLTFRGVISGNGNLTKVGDQITVLSGISTYTGSTNVNGGILSINYNSLASTSGINVGIDGNLAVNISSGSGSFSTPVSGLGAFTKLGLGTLVVDTASSWVTGSVNVVEGELKVTNVNNRAVLTGYNVDVSTGATYSVNTAVDATWGGSLSGTGTMVKTGNGSLTITRAVGLSEENIGDQGVVHVRGGSIFAYNLPANYQAGTFGTLKLESGTVYRDTVAQTTGAQTLAGIFLPVASTVGLSIGQTVSGIGIQPGSTIVAITGSSITLSLPTTAAVMSLVAVQETFGGDIVAANDNASASTVLPVFEKAGAGALTIGAALSFTGDILVSGGTFKIGANGALNQANSIELQDGATLSVPHVGGLPATLSLSNLKGSVNSTIDAPDAQLSFTATAGASARTYLGLITGQPSVSFAEIRALGDTTASPGTLRLIRPVGSPNSIFRIDINSGVLIGNLAGFGADAAGNGGAELHVSAGATIGFDNDDVTHPLTYNSQVFGSGSVLKTGRGTITLADGSLLVSAYHVEAGKLRVFDGRGSTSQSLVDSDIAAGATLEVTLGGGYTRTLGAQITGAGGLEISNSTTNWSTVRLEAATSLSAITLGNYVELEQRAISAMPGISGSATSRVSFAVGGDIAVNQSLNTTFLGVLSAIAPTRLTFTGPGRASLLNPLLGTDQESGPIKLVVGTISSPGNLEVDSRYTNTNSDRLTLVQGTLAVNTLAGSPTTFTANLSGSDNAVTFIKTGLGDLSSGNSVASTIFSSYQVDAGRLLVSVDSAGKILGGRQVLVSGGTLAIQQGATAATLSAANFPVVNSAGFIEVIGNGPSSPRLTLLGSFAGGLTLSNDANVVLGATDTAPIQVGGTVTIAAGSTLSGQAFIGTASAPANLDNNAGTISPGFSPGVITVNGNVNGFVGAINPTAGTFEMELSSTQANGTYNDLVKFTGTADLNAGGTGKLILKQYDANLSSPVSPAFGRRHVLFKDTAVDPLVPSFTSVIPQAQITAQGIDPFRYLLSIPGTLTKTAAVGAAGSSVVTLTDVSELVVGQAVTGANIPAHSSISAIDTGTKQVTLNTTLAQAVSGNIQFGLGSAGVPVVDGEVAVYVVRAPSAYDAFKAPVSLLNAVKLITRVNSDLVGNGGDLLAHTADDAYRSTPAWTYNSVGGGLAILSDVQLQSALDNLTPYGAAGTVTAATGLFHQVSDSAARRLELRRFDRSSLTILSNEWYVDTVGGQFAVDDKSGLSNKATTYGITAGYSTQARVDGVAGFSLTAEHFSLSSDVDTHASGNGFALSGYIGTVAARGQVSLDAGATLSYLSSSITRDSVVAGSNSSSAHALTFGAWARIGTVLSAKSSNTYFTPFLGVDFETTKLSDLKESGEADAMDVSSGSISSSTLRVGFGIHHMWEEGRGDWRYRLSADLGYAKQLSGEFGDFTSSNTTGLNTTYTSSLRVNAGSGFYVNPSLNFGPDENSTYSIGVTYQQGNGKSVGLNAGYRKRF